MKRKKNKKRREKKVMMKRANYVIATANSIVYPISRMYTLAECERICKQYNREQNTAAFKAVKFTTAAGLNK